MQDDEDRVDIGRIWRAIWRRKWLVTAATLLGALLFFAMTVVQDRQYTANMSVILDAREQRVLNAKEQVVSDLKLSKPIIESEVTLLRSASMMTKVVDSIGIDRFDTIDPALQPPSLVNRVLDLTKTVVKRLLGSEETSDLPQTGGLISPEQRRLSRIVRTLIQGLYVRRVGESYVIETSVRTTDRELSALVANTLASTYIEAQLADRQRVAEAATAWLSEQVDVRRTSLTEVEAAVEAYKRDQLNQAGASEDVLSQQLAELTQQLALARSERATEQARLTRIEALLLERGAAAAAETQTSPYLTELRQERSTLTREDARLATTLLPNHPDRRNIASELALIDGSIETEVRTIANAHRNEIDVLLTREAALQGEVDSIENRLSDIATASLRLRQLEREAEAARDSFEDFLGRLGETRAQVEIQRAEAKLVNPALIPAGPSAPRVKLMTAFGLTVGLTIGLVAAIALEMLGAGFSQTSDLERASGVPVLSTIPLEKVPRPRSVLRMLESSSYSLLSERIRQLRTTLALNVRQGEPITVAMLSSVPNEGKTTTALALALSFAKSGRSTIFVDLDTRRSKLFEDLSDSADYDLTDYMAQTVSLDHCIGKMVDHELWITGTREHKALLADNVPVGALDTLFQELGRRFEVIIVDAPPVLAVSDGLAIAATVDQIIYMVRYRKTTRKTLMHGLAVLKNLDIRPTGLVMSMAKIEDDPEVYAYGYTYE